MTINEKSSVQYWETWLSSGKVCPVFQPIVSAETGKIYGYEVLGRLQVQGINGNSSLVSLGSFFMAHMSYPNRNGKTMMALKKEIDQKIRSIALTEFAGFEDDDSCIFLNISPSSIIEFIENPKTTLPHTIELIRKLGIKPERIVIEITEEPINAKPEIIKTVIDLYRAEGYRIAIDDVGSESSNLDRIGLFHPDIIKVDLQMLRRSVFSRNFKEILLTLSRLGESLGSSLLFEGIETEEELYNALNYGSRYMQGYFFSEPNQKFQESSVFEESLYQNIQKFHERKKKEIYSILGWEESIQMNLSNLNFTITNNGSKIELDTSPIVNLNIEFFRLYVTDNLGKQVSPNYYMLMNGKIAQDESFIGKNWSWRPYFYEHFYKIANSKTEWVVSSVYHDINENITLKTFSRNLEGNLIVFIDISLVGS
ncbi:MAG: EAL domain-containing protein [Leptospira sp.]|nr:EAL domain-containing protein [Leptospira sp.]